MTDSNQIEQWIIAFHGDGATWEVELSFPIPESGEGWVIMRQVPISRCEYWVESPDDVRAAFKHLWQIDIPLDDLRHALRNLNRNRKGKPGVRFQGKTAWTGDFTDYSMTLERLEAAFRQILEDHKKGLTC